MLKLILFLCLAGILWAEETLPALGEAEPSDAKKLKYGFAGLPIVGYSSGFGTGFGAVGSFYKKEPLLNPYRYELDAQVYFTTTGLQSHKLRFDYIDVANLPLRLRGMVGMFANFNENYCGKGMLADCNIQKPDIPDFYLSRYLEVFGITDGRWRLRPLPHKIEIIWSWRGSYYRIGDWKDSGPYPNSLYSEDFGTDKGDGEGFASVIEAGLMLDGRDFEPAPTKGYWIEATLRESSPYWGSNWSYLGANLSLRGYLPLEPSKRLVLASQVIFDAMSGHAPLQEIVRVGGTGRYFNTFGGQEIGRGLREQYFPGRLKAYKQLELRYQFWGFNLWHWHLDMSAATFADLGLVAWDFNSLDKEPFKPAIGFGGGLRFLWDEAVVIRFDVATSPIESYSPKFYFVIGNVF